MFPALFRARCSDQVPERLYLLDTGAFGIGFFSGVGRCGGAVRLPGQWRLSVLSVPPVLGLHRVERLLRFPVALVEDPDHPIGASAVVITAKSAGRKVFGLATADVRLA